MTTPRSPRRRARNRRSTQTGLVMATLVGLVVSVVLPGVVGASSGPKKQAAAISTDPISITSVTPWVDSEGEFQMRFTVADSVPAEAKLTYTIHQPLNASSRRSPREALTEVLNGGSPGKVLQAPVTTPLATYGTAEGSSLLSIPVRSTTSSDRSRAFLPNPGIHPISIVLTAPDGPELWSKTVFLNHLPRDFGTPESTDPPLTTSLVVPVSTRPALTTGTPSLSVRDTAEIDALSRLLRGAPDAPLKVLLRGDVIAGLERINDKWSRDTIDVLRTAFGGSAPTPSDTPTDTPSGEPDSSSTTTTASTSTTTSTTSTTQPTTTTAPPSGPTSGSGDSSSSGTDPASYSGPVLVTSSFVPVDTEAIARANGTSVLRSQIDLSSKIGAEVSHQPLLGGTWLMDEHLGPTAATALESLGYAGVVVSQSQLTGGERDAGRLSRLSPTQVAGTRSLRAIALDKDISSMLADDTVSPIGRAHQVLTTLFADWFDNSTSRDSVADPTAVISVQPTTDPTVVAAIGAALLGNGPIITTPSTWLIPPTDQAEGGGSGRTVTLRTPTLTDSASVAINEIATTTRRIDAFGSAAPDEPDLDLWRLRNAESLAAELSTADVGRIHRSIRSQIGELTGMIHPPDPRRVLLAGRDTSIPLRFKNDLDYEVTLLLHARSPRLRTPDDKPITITLKPGENRIDLPLVVQAPGESLLRIRLTTPDDQLAISAFDIPVQSTAISGVGALLSIVSVLFLMLWWFRTFRRNRRDQARSGGSHPSGSPQSV